MAKAFKKAAKNSETTKNSYVIISAHSGTNDSEIAKAKRHYRNEQKKGALYGSAHGEPVQIAFTDTNNRITARFTNFGGTEICKSFGII